MEESRSPKAKPKEGVTVIKNVNDIPTARKLAFTHRIVPFESLTFMTPAEAEKRIKEYKLKRSMA
jgi:hypothetical protein